MLEISAQPEQNLGTCIREALHCIMALQSICDKMTSWGGLNPARVNREQSGDYGAILQQRYPEKGHGMVTKYKDQLNQYF